jgi:hypothetical protein
MKRVRFFKKGEAMEEGLLRDNEILNRLTSLPRKIISLHGQENITEFVLHELCQKNCLNFEKAAYFIDNPDFNCLKGMAGYWRPEAYSSQEDIWVNPKSFSAYMQESPFNKKVRTFAHTSFHKNKKDEQLVELIAQGFEFADPGYYAWNMKHDNHGLLVYEKQIKTGASCSVDYILNGLSLLAFCPVF